MMHYSFLHELNQILTNLCQFLVLLNYFEQDQESSSCSCSRLSLPSSSHSLVSYPSLEQDQSKYPASL